MELPNLSLQGVSSERAPDHSSTSPLTFQHVTLSLVSSSLLLCFQQVVTALPFTIPAPPDKPRLSGLWSFFPCATASCASCPNTASCSLCHHSLVAPTSSRHLFLGGGQSLSNKLFRQQESGGLWVLRQPFLFFSLHYQCEPKQKANVKCRSSSTLVQIKLFAN